MLTPLQNVKMQFSHVEFPNLFQPDCEPGDWQWKDVIANFSEPPRVILTASDLGAEQSSGHFTAVVGVAQDVGTTGFRLAGRNSDCSPGVAHMNWLALLETGKPQGSTKRCSRSASTGTASRATGTAGTSASASRRSGPTR